jgi:maleate cis-trans isomerase
VKSLSKFDIIPIKSIHLDIKNKEDLFKYSSNTLMNRIKQEITPEMDGICVLCTNFVTMDFVNEIEETFKVPFISSNLAIMYEIQDILKK